MRVARRKAAVLVRVTGPHMRIASPARARAGGRPLHRAGRDTPPVAGFQIEQTSQGLDYRDLESRREAADIVVGF